MSADRGTYVVYDGSCPFCTHYVGLLRLREAVGPVTMINARDDHEIVRYVKSKGVDLDREMALVVNGQIYAGADCMHSLALMSTDAGVLNKLMARVFASHTMARTLYPVLRSARNLTLRVLGHPPIPR